MKIKIPQIIHYCWFGLSDKPNSVIKCIESWKKYLSEYRIIEWNEKNFSIDDAPSYVKEAYEAKKYAFVSDFVRMKALYEYGGLYFDTDLEVLSRFDEQLQNVSLVLAFESKELLMTAFIACTEKNEFVKQFLGTYYHRHFLLGNGQYDTTPNTDFWSLQAEEWGVNLKCNTVQEIGKEIMVYPIEYFCGFDVENNHEAIKTNTKTVHHMACSWADNRTKRRNKIIRCIQNIIGTSNYDFLRKIKKNFNIGL